MLKSLFFSGISLGCLAIPLLAEQPANVTKIDYSKEAAVIEDSSTRLAFENDGTGTREASARVRLQSDAGVQHYGLLVFTYQSSSETMDVDFIRVRKPDGTVIVTPAADIQDMAAEISRQAPLYSDQHEKHVAVKGLGVGDVLEYQAHWHNTKPLVSGQFWYSYDFLHDDIILREQLQISVARDRLVKWKSPEIKPAITEEGSRRVFTWTHSNLERKTTDQGELEKERTQYQAARGLFPLPEVQFSSFQSWEEIGRWYSQLQQDRVQPSPEVRAKAAELTKNLTNEDAKIRAIYSYVSTQYRYIGIAFGIGRFQPHNATEVLSNQYGDCKDKHTLLAALLSAIGVTADPALISSRHELDRDVPSISQFDHVITAVPRGKQWLWLDTTSELAPFEHLVPSVRNKQALVIPSDGAPTFVTTPADPPFQTESVFKAEAKLTEAGVLDSQMEQSLRGDPELLMRILFRRVPQSQWKELVQQISFGSGFGGTVSEVVASSPEATDTPFHVSYAYNRKDYSDWENRRITPPFPPMMLPSLNNDQTSFALPLWLGAPGESVLQATIKMPSGYTPELPQAVDIKRDFADYHASYDLKKGVLNAERRLVIKLREVPLSEFGEYKSFRKAIEDDQDRYIILARKDSSADAWPGPFVGNPALGLPDSDDPDAMQAERLAREAIQRQDMAAAIGSLKRAVEADPSFSRDWVLLGQLYMASRNTDLALEAFRKGVEANPESPLPRRTLAFGLMAANRPSDAINAWQELLKINPEDSEAAYSLGSTLLSQKRFADAISPLEVSSKAAPESIPRLLTLASAYLRSGNSEKGVATFESALKLRPGAQTENDFGYELADANIRLSDALQHAQKAVQATEDASSKVTLAKLEADDLAHTRDLSAFWDTLGWVYFRMSNLPKAEQYLSASFELSQNSTVADHLGQVYEYEHKTEAAIRMYRLALATNSNMPETQGRLTRLNHSETRPQNIVAAEAELSQLRSTKLGRIAPGPASAEFFLLFGSGPRLEAVKFINGSQKLRPAEKTLLSAHFKVPFPDGSSARLVRRGILSCYPTTGCTFVVFLPESVRSVN